MKRYICKCRKTYNSWYFMKLRCNDPSRRGYENYGGRGITYDPRWEDFENFVEDMGVRPYGLQLDRKDNDKGYSKDNCRWTDTSEQARNKRISPLSISGVAGVTFYEPRQKWLVTIKIHGYKKHIGYFFKLEEAIEARRKAERDFL